MVNRQWFGWLLFLMIFLIPLESVAVEGSAFAIPGGDTARQDPLDCASVKVCEDFR